MTTLLPPRVSPRISPCEKPLVRHGGEAATRSSSVRTAPCRPAGIEPTSEWEGASEYGRGRALAPRERLVAPPRRQRPRDVRPATYRTELRSIDRVAPGRVSRMPHAVRTVRKPRGVRWSVVVGVAAVVVGWGATMMDSWSAEEIPTAVAVVAVGEGQTLDELAREFAPQSDRGAVIKRIRELNNLSGTPHAGQTLLVPDAAAR